MLTKNKNPILLLFSEMVLNKDLVKELGMAIDSYSTSHDYGFGYNDFRRKQIMEKFIVGVRTGSSSKFEGQQGIFRDYTLDQMEDLLGENLCEVKVPRNIVQTVYAKGPVRLGNIIDKISGSGSEGPYLNLRDDGISLGLSFFRNQGGLMEYIGEKKIVAVVGDRSTPSINCGRAVSGDLTGYIRTS